MAVYKKVMKSPRNVPAQPEAPGRPVAPGQPEDVTMPVFSYSNTGLARFVIKAWKTEELRTALLERDRPGVPSKDAVDRATKEINKFSKFGLRRAVVITEKEHDDDYTMQDEDEVVFVLPNLTRVKNLRAAPRELLETARMLMACTPNGI